MHAVRRAGDWPQPARSRVEQVQLGDAGFVDRQRERLAVLRQVEALDVPFEVGGERRQLLRGDVDVAEPLELAVLVGGHIHAAAVGREHGGPVRHVLRRIGQRRLLAVRRIDQPQRALRNRRELHDQQAAVVRRPVERLPAAASDLHHQLVGFRVRRIHDVEVAVGAVAARRAVGKAIALGAPAPPPFCERPPSVSSVMRPSATS